MANSLLEICNRWQIQRAVILERNPAMAITIDGLDMMVEHAVRSAITIAHRVDFDFREAEQIAKQVVEDGDNG